MWGPEHVGEGWLLRDVVKKLRRKLGDNAADPRYIFTEPRVGYRMAGDAENLFHAPQGGTAPGADDVL